MKTNVTVTLLVLLTSIPFFALLNRGGFSIQNAASQEQTGTTAPRTAVKQHTKPPAVSVIHVSFRPLNLALIPGGNPARSTVTPVSSGMRQSNPC